MLDCDKADPLGYSTKATVAAGGWFVEVGLISHRLKLCRHLNDIWKLGCTIDSGASSRTASAATVSVRSVKVGRSTITPISTIATMMKERWVATSAPDKSR